MKTIFILVALFMSFNLKEQSNIVTTGGETSGSNTKDSQEVKEPFEISAITGIERKEIQIKPFVYPNQTKSVVILSFDTDVPAKIHYEVNNVAGKLLSHEKVITKNTPISMSYLSEGTYFLKIIQDERELKSFKIIKNK